METVGTRIKNIREIRGFSQKYVANKIGVHVTLLQQYERGIKKPKERQLQNIADALLVDINMLRLPKAKFGDEILAYLYELINCHENVSIVEDDGVFNIRIPINVRDAEMIPHLREAADACKRLTKDEFKLWLLNYRYRRFRTVDFSTGRTTINKRYPELEVTHTGDTENDES